MNDTARAEQFARLHRKGEPVILYNAWDAGSAKAVAEGGARAVATGSWSVAAAHGYEDGEALPLDLAIANLERIVSAVDLPVTLDFEGGYAAGPEALRDNIERVIGAGAVGINFEDQVVGGEGLFDIDTQRERIGAVRAAAERSGVPLFINARTDIFLQAEPSQHDEEMLEEAITRSSAYAEAGASGFFAPGLWQEARIRTLCEQSPLPVNILMWKGVPPTAALADCGVARISYGPQPYRQAMQALAEAARRAVDW